MDQTMLLVHGIAGDLNRSHGSGELDRLSDEMLRDIGYKRLVGRVVKDEDPFEDASAPARPIPWILFRMDAGRA
jgi:hypothetical protein